ncbi:MAG: efflux RND transporter permease subunit, partial [Planctomycetes bacterium]|nr:efflux RND transporter permease subunit [Planctomycetota bacterium]
NILVGAGLALIVLHTFLRSISGTAVVAIAIPISAVGTFLGVFALGRSLNVIMLAGMTFAVGMVVDNAIVVLENIYRHRVAGKNRRDAALDGAREVWGAVLASTLTTMAVFLPVITISEEAGQLFQDIAYAIATAVGLSLVVSVLLIPLLASKFFNATRARAVRGDKPWPVARAVSLLVRKINERVGTRIAVVAGISGLAILGSFILTPGTEYLPAGNKNMVFGFLHTPPGYSIEEFKRMAIIVEEGDPDVPNDGIRPAWEAKLGSKQAARLPSVEIPIGRMRDSVRTVTPPPIENYFFVSFGGTAFMGATSKEETNVKPLEYLMNRAGGRLPGVFAFFTQTSLFRGGLQGGNTVDIEIRADDLDAVIESARAIMDRIMETGYEYPKPNPANFALGRPEIQLIPDRAKAANLGLDVRDVGFVLESCIDGAFVGEYNDHGDKIDMVITVAGTDNATVEQIGQIPIHTPSGHVIPIASIAELKQTTAPQQINHIEEMSSVTLSVKSKTGVPLQETMRELQEDIIAPLRESGAIAPSVMTVLAGTADKLTQTQRALLGNFEGVVTQPRIFGLSIGVSVMLLCGICVVIVGVVRFAAGTPQAVAAAGAAIALLVIGFLAANPQLLLTIAQSRAILALAITYLLMAALFESFIYPLVIMFSVPLAAVGGFAALRIVHEVSLYDITSPIQQLDVLTMLGFVILVGIVVNNAILIVHQTLNFQRRDGIDTAAAVAMSVQTRTRPIVMSALTSVFGMAPLVIMPGAGSELYRGLGSVVLGGLLVSTVFTLIIVPAVLTLVVDFRKWLQSLSEKQHHPRPAVAGAQTATDATAGRAVTRSPE